MGKGLATKNLFLKLKKINFVATKLEGVMP